MARRPIRSALVASGALVTAGVVGLMAASPALTATDDAATSVRRSVQTLMDPSGEVKASRVYTQVQSSGVGAVSFIEQLSGSLRNLNSFGQPATTTGDKATWDYSVSGLSNQRTLQDYPASSLPITVKATATLDGKPIEIADIVGKTGLLKMTYVITNTTAQDQEITWTDGAGVKQTKTVSIPLPYVGSMDTVLPDSYAQINAPGASVGGTGRNSTQLSYTLLLYPPLGSTTATVSYEARVTDAEVPGVDFTFLPTPPSGNPTTKSALEQYQGGQQTGAKLTDGATQIDTNLLKLADGAGQLNDGLAQLLAGANQLSAGLAPAVDGAQQLADGLAPAASGAQQLADGLDTAVSGSAQIAAGADAASSGADQLESGSAQVATGNKALAAGLASLQDGISDLYNALDNLSALLAAKPDFQKLKGALAGVQAAIGSPNSTGSTTLLGGMNGLRAGLDNPSLAGPTSGQPCDANAAVGSSGWCGLKDALQLLSFGLSNSACDIADPANPLNPCGAVQGVDAVAAALADASATGGSLDQLIGAAKLAYAQEPCPAAAPGSTPVAGVYPPSVLVGTFLLSPTSNCVLISNLAYGLGLPEGILSPTDPGGVKAQSAKGATSLESVSTGLTGAALPAITKMIGGIGTDSASGTLLNGTFLIKLGLSNPACNLADPTNAANPCGVKEIQGLVSLGIDALVQGISDEFSAAVGKPTPGCDPTATLACATAALSAGATALAGGATQVADGNADLATGLARLSDGSAQLAAGLPAAQDGAQQLADGLPAAAAGAQQLADGLPAAADGAGQIADGLEQAVPGGTQIEDGANQLSTEGTKQLIVAGQDTTNSFGEKAATMEAIDARAADGSGIPNGEAVPQDGSDVITTGAYGFFMDSVSKSDSQNALRFILAGLLLAGAVGAGVALGRR